MRFSYFTFILLALCVVGVSCSNPTPKPYGYFRIALPENSYRILDKNYPYTFDVSTFAADSAVTQGKGEYWLNIYYPQLKGCIYCSYMPIHGNFRTIAEDCRKFVYKHTIKAEAITEQPYGNPGHKVYGILYDIKGDAASPIQFMLTDSVHHVLRGALYFDAVPNKDSIAPVLNYVRKDIIRMIETTKWK
jgi:gliding motility-associated lipoprotein GldD